MPGAVAAEPSSAKAPKVFVSILNWNGIENTLTCLKSVLAMTYPNLRVVVVDNGSTDGSVDILRGMTDRIDLIEHEENRGFTGGCNAAIRHALSNGGEYVWLLNNDSECEPEALSKLVAYAETRPDVGLVSPIIADRGTRKDCFAVRRLDLATGKDAFPLAPADVENVQQAYPSQIILRGTALLLKRSVAERIGLLDDRLFAYCEEDDYCIRSAAAGFRAVCVTTARIYHDEDRPGGGWRKPYAYYYHVRNGILFWRKHGRGLGAWKHARWNVCMMFRVLARAGYGKAETEALADGLWSGLRGATGRWDPSNPLHRMPWLLRQLFVRNPALSQAVIEAEPKAVLRALWRRAL